MFIIDLYHNLLNIMIHIISFNNSRNIQIPNTVLAQTHQQ
jgi:hypothetical protein